MSLLCTPSAHIRSSLELPAVLRRLSCVMLKSIRLACAIALPLLICGCQSFSTQRIQLVVAQCQPLPALAAWFMEERAPDLTQRMLNELLGSPTTATRD